MRELIKNFPLQIITIVILYMLVMGFIDFNLYNNAYQKGYKDGLKNKPYQIKSVIIDEEGCHIWIDNRGFFFHKNDGRKVYINLLEEKEKLDDEYK